jgi:hypothetical protein
MTTEPKERGLDAAQGILTGLIIMLPVWVVIGAILAIVFK